VANLGIAFKEKGGGPPNQGRIRPDNDGDTEFLHYVSFRQQKRQVFGKKKYRRSKRRQKKTLGGGSVRN